MPATPPRRNMRRTAKRQKREENLALRANFCGRGFQPRFAVFPIEVAPKRYIRDASKNFSHSCFIKIQTSENKEKKRKFFIDRMVEYDYCAIID